MKVVEIRDLDGPNLFILEPAIKFELALSDSPADDAAGKSLERQFGAEDLSRSDQSQPSVPGAIRAAARAVAVVHRLVNQPCDICDAVTLETPDHYAVYYSWTHRRFALAVAAIISEVIEGESIDQAELRLRLETLMQGPAEPDDAPLMIRDGERAVFTIGVTGTNGKTTTTRLIAHLLRAAGRSVGWSSSSGVYINGEEVMTGDYSGPAGARRVLTDPSIDAAVLETARGGILLRGLAYQSNDVGVFTNVSADHVDLQGVRTVEGLAKVKSVVCRVTKPSGHVVVNADDPLVLRSTAASVAPRLLVSTDANSLRVQAHVSSGGRAFVLNSGWIETRHWKSVERIAHCSHVPMTYGGKARFMVENALHGVAVAYAAGLTIDDIREGLQSFSSDSGHNPGRLNLFKVRDRLVVLDYAHNEAGLEALIDFAESFRSDAKRLVTIVGTAGDRNEDSIRALGRIAAERSDYVIAKGTVRYLRGRVVDDLIQLYLDGINEVGGTPFKVAESELAAVELALQEGQPGDIVAIMAQEDTEPILDYLKRQEAQELTDIIDA
jgi:cyanophycin synthetase